MSRGTPHRNVRVPDELWGRALARAEEEGTSVSAVLVRALEEWVESPAGVRACASLGCNAPAEWVGTYDDGETVERGVAYCDDCRMLVADFLGEFWRDERGVWVPVGIPVTPPAARRSRGRR